MVKIKSEQKYNAIETLRRKTSLPEFSYKLEQTQPTWIRNMKSYKQHTVATDQEQ